MKDWSILYAQPANVLIEFFTCSTIERNMLEKSKLHANTNRRMVGTVRVQAVVNVRVFVLYNI